MGMIKGVVVANLTVFEVVFKAVFCWTGKRGIVQTWLTDIFFFNFCYTLSLFCAYFRQKQKNEKLTLVYC